MNEVFLHFLLLTQQTYHIPRWVCHCILQTNQAYSLSHSTHAHLGRRGLPRALDVVGRTREAEFTMYGVI